MDCEWRSAEGEAGREGVVITWLPEPVQDFELLSCLHWHTSADLGAGIVVIFCNGNGDGWLSLRVCKPVRMAVRSGVDVGYLCLWCHV